MYDLGNFYEPLMSAQASPQPQTELERQLAARVEELSGLLAHLMSCWDDEKRQLARQLHDNLGSSMTALTMHLGLLAQQLPEGKPRDRAAQMKQLLTTIIETNRQMQYSLWNDKLEFLGVKPALAELVEEFGREHGIATRASLTDEDISYSRDQGVALLRCAQEGLRNVAAHAQATQAEVTLDDDGDQVMLTVRDNGTGPKGGDGDSSSCHGLRLLRERARFLGGSLELSARPEGGSALTLILPKHA